MPKFLGLFSKRGLTTFLASCFLTTAGAGATFLPLAFFPFGYKKERNMLFLLLPPMLMYLKELSIHIGNAFSQAFHQPGSCPA